VARERVPSDRAEFEVADAESFVVAPGSFDVVLCGFVIMFLQDRVAALARMRDALRPGGRLVLSIPDADLPTPRASKGRWMQKYGFPPPVPVDVVGGLSEVGLEVVSHHEETAGFEFADGHAYLEWLRSHGGRLALDLLSGDELDAYEREQVEAAEADRGPDGRLVMETKASFWVATRQ
jgi:SAM-dependent methyltransferase